jgi:hypothetical protein
MFRFIDRNNWGVPLEAEVENHLVRKYEEDLMKANTLFAFVRWCAPTNSQEKHAEQFNRQKKYGYEKRYQDGIGRFYAKNESSRTEGERVYDETNDKYVFKEITYDYDRLVADDRATIVAYNNSLHRDQKRFFGKTRMDVLRENMNPDLRKPRRPVLARYIGECADTTIRRNMYCRVQYADYMLPSADILSKMAPGDYGVKAYYIPCDDDSIEEVYLYQNDKYLCPACKIKKFTTATAEWAECDDEAMTSQAKYISHFDKSIKDGKENKIKKVEIIEPRALLPEIPCETIEIPLL